MNAARVYIARGVELPEFSGVPSNFEWKSTRGLLDREHGPYKITSDGYLLRKEIERVQTDREKTIEVTNETVTVPKYKTINDEWVVHPQHGSFEFHATIDGTRYAYEARFTNTTLDEIVLLEQTQK